MTGLQERTDLIALAADEVVTEAYARDVALPGAAIVAWAKGSSR